MSTTTSIADTSLAPTREGAPDAAGGTRPGRLGWAGLGGIVFAVTIIVQNILRGAGSPANDADPAAVVHYFATHRGIEWTLVVLFSIGGFGITLFAGGLWARTTSADPRTRPWAQTGVIGVCGIVAIFSTMVACEVALMTLAHQPAAAPEAVTVVWLLHNSVFAVLTLSMAVALLGLSQAASQTRVVPALFKPVGIVGASLLALNTALAPAVAETSTPLLAFGLAGFVCWVAFVATAGYTLLHG